MENGLERVYKLPILDQIEIFKYFYHVKNIELIDNYAYDLIKAKASEKYTLGEFSDSSYSQRIINMAENMIIQYKIKPSYE